MKTKIPEMTDSVVLAMALDDMELLGLIRWKPDADEKAATVSNPQGQEHHAITDKVAA